MLLTDGTNHTRLRDSVRDVFTPSFITGLTDGIEAIAATVVDHPTTGTAFDFMTDIAQPLPLTVAAEWLDLDTETSKLLREESPTVIRLLTSRPDDTRIIDGIDSPHPSTVAELPRLDGPVQAAARTATEDRPISGVDITSSQQVLVVIAAANRDSAVFDEPNRFRPGRGGPAPLTFGYGAHYCLGAALARLETTATLRRILARKPVLAGSAVWRDTAAIRGPLSVPIVFRHS